MLDLGPNVIDIRRAKGILQGMAYQSATSAGRQIVLMVGLRRGAGRCRSRVLTVSQLSHQAKENPVRGADFERGKFSGGAAHRDTALMRRAAEGYYHRLPLIICPEPDSEMGYGPRDVLPLEHPGSSALGTVRRPAETAYFGG
jgi:hypothetical protein